VDRVGWPGGLIGGPASEIGAVLPDIDDRVYVWDWNSFQIRRGSENVFDCHSDRSALNVPLSVVQDYGDWAVAKWILAPSENAG